MWNPVVFRLAGVWLIILALGGCLPSQASYEFGLGTTEIDGIVSIGEENPANTDIIVVTLKYHYKFIPIDSEEEYRDFPDPLIETSLTHPTAHFQKLGADGRFSITMPFDVVSVQIMFIAPGHLTDVFKYSRSLGMGKITYRSFLPVMENWKSHYYTFLEPQLQHFIVENRYNLSNYDQQNLGDWLSNQKNRLTPLTEKSAGK